MKLAPLAAALFLAATPLAASAQSADISPDEIVALKQVQTDRRAYFIKNLELTEKETKDFWAVYNEYSEKLRKLDERFVANVNRFAEKYETLSDGDATDILKEKMAVEQDRMNLKQEYTRKVASVLPPKKALRYAQIESRIETLLRRETYTLIPLAR